MGGYLFKRIVWGFLSAFCTVALVMGILYGTMDRNLVFSSDSVYQKLSGNLKTAYIYEKWDEYGYLDCVFYSEYLDELVQTGKLTAEEREQASAGKTPAEDTALAAEMAERFLQEYGRRGYTVARLDAKTDSSGNYLSGGQEQFFAFREYGMAEIFFRYLAGILEVDHVNRAEGNVGERKLTFTLYDPVYGGEKFSPAILGNGTTHRFLLYFDSRFPYLHQNFITIHLGKSISVTKDTDVFDTMTASQGSFVLSETQYPTGYTEMSADDLHSAVYVEGSLSSIAFLQTRYADDYTSVKTVKSGLSKVGYSFLIGSLAVLLSYLLALPFSTLMAMHPGKLWDILGSAFVAFMTAVPALAYLFLFKALGELAGLPVRFRLDAPELRMLILPIVCIMLPSSANLIRWNRRYAADQMSGDYVLFARACGSSRWEILMGQVLPNAIIPLIHGIPWSIFSALAGAIMTERVFDVPGAGNLLTTAIEAYDNSVIVGLTLFYALVSVASSVLGDLFTGLADPRISFSRGKGGTLHA